MGRDKLSVPELKKAATELLADHTKMLIDLKTLAAKKQVTVPATNTQMSANASLPNTSGKEFDVAWLNRMYTMHEAKLTELQNVLTHTNDADIKAYAAAAVSKINLHIKMLSKIMTSAESKPVHKTLKL